MTSLSKLPKRTRHDYAWPPLPDADGRFAGGAVRRAWRQKSVFKLARAVLANVDPEFKAESRRLKWQLAKTAAFGKAAEGSIPAKSSALHFNVIFSLASLISLGKFTTNLMSGTGLVQTAWQSKEWLILPLFYAGIKTLEWRTNSLFLQRQLAVEQMPEAMVNLVADVETPNPKDSPKLQKSKLKAL